MSWHEMQTVNDHRFPWAWSRPKVMLNMALAVLFTTGAILVGFMFPAAGDERPPDPFGNHTIELNQDTGSAEEKMSTIVLSHKAAKLMKLCDLEGYKRLNDLLKVSVIDSLCPAICMTEGCD